LIKWKRRNIPIPEAHVVGLVLGCILQVFFAHKIFQATWIGHGIGWPLIVAGIGLSLWSVLEVREMDIAAPNKLLTSGPYAYSRNPMYVGWMLIYLGISLVANSVWIIGLFPIVAAYIHFVNIRREERTLEQAFEDHYIEYCRRVRRYF